MKDLSPYIEVFFNSDKGKVCIGKIGWDGNTMIVQGTDDATQNRIQGIWNGFMKYDTKELKGLTPEATLEYVWHNLNNATYYTFGKPVISNNPVDDKVDESKESLLPPIGAEVGYEAARHLINKYIPESEKLYEQNKLDYEKICALASMNWSVHRFDRAIGLWEKALYIKPNDNKLKTLIAEAKRFVEKKTELK